MHEFVKVTNVQAPPTVKLRYSPRDVSFFLAPSSAGGEPSDQQLLAAVGDHPCVESVRVHDRFVHPANGKRSLTLRMDFYGNGISFAKLCCVVVSFCCLSGSVVCCLMLARSGFLSPSDAVTLQRVIGEDLVRKVRIEREMEIHASSL
jgi:hypothetical protein